jgi:hypothetical protein
VSADAMTAMDATDGGATDLLLYLSLGALAGVLLVGGAALALWLRGRGRATESE